jgi:hypothetical protein
MAETKAQFLLKIARILESVEKGNRHAARAEYETLASSYEKFQSLFAKKEQYEALFGLTDIATRSAQGEKWDYLAEAQELLLELRQEK